MNSIGLLLMNNIHICLYLRIGIRSLKVAYLSDYVKISIVVKLILGLCVFEST